MNIDKQYYISKMKKYNHNLDTEVAHKYADSLLCEILEELGYEDIVEEYEKIDKWYA